MATPTKPALDRDALEAFLSNTLATMRALHGRMETEVQAARIDGAVRALDELSTKMDTGLFDQQN